MRDVANLAKWAQDVRWLSDGDPHHAGMIMDADFGFVRHEDRFSGAAFGSDDVTVTVDVEWKGEGHGLSDLTRDLFVALGEFTEEMAFVTREVGANDVTYHILTGGETHGHHLRIRSHGPRVEDMLEGFRAIQAVRRAQK